MYRQLHSILFPLIVVLLAACGGGGDSGSAQTDPVITGRLVGVTRDLFLEIDTRSGRAGNAMGLGLAGHLSIKGMAYDPLADMLYGVDVHGQLLTIDPATGEVSTVIGGTGFAQIQSLAFDSARRILYGYDNLTSRLVRIDTGSGLGTDVATLGAGPISGMTWDPVSGLLYGLTGASLSTLITIDPVAGTFQVVGDTGFAAFSNLVFDPVSGQLYAILAQGSKLVAIDPVTGTGTDTGAIPAYRVSALAYVDSQQAFYAASEITGRIVRLEIPSGTAVSLAAFGDGNMYALAYDARTDVLYGWSYSGDLSELDRYTGRRRVLGNTGPGFIESMAMDTRHAVLYGIGGGAPYNYSGHELYTLDTLTGAMTLVGPTGFDSVSAIAYDPNSDSLYGIDSNSQALIVIDRLTGAGSLVANLDFYPLGVLAFDVLTDTLYGMEIPAASQSRELMAINVNTGAGTPAGTVLGLWSIEDMTYVGTEQRLYMLDPGNGELATYNPVTRVRSVVNAPAAFRLTGLAGDPVSGTIYGLEKTIAFATTGTILSRIDPVASTAFLLHEFGRNLHALAFNPASGELYSVDSSSDELVRIDPVSGTLTVAGTLTTGGIDSIACDPGTHVLYALAGNTPAALYSVDPDTAVTTYIADIDTVPFAAGLAFDPGSGLLVAAESRDQQLVVIDPATGDSRIIGPTGYAFMQDLELLP